MLLWKFEQGKCFKTDETKSQKTEGRVHAHLPLPTYYRISRRFSNRDGSIFLAEAHPSSIKWAECYRWLPIIPTTIRSRREMTIGSFFFHFVHTLCHHPSCFENSRAWYDAGIGILYDLLAPSQAGSSPQNYEGGGGGGCLLCGRRVFFFRFGLTRGGLLRITDYARSR